MPAVRATGCLFIEPDAHRAPSYRPEPRLSHPHSNPYFAPSLVLATKSWNGAGRGPQRTQRPVPEGNGRRVCDWAQRVKRREVDNVRAKLEFAICLGSRFAAPPWARNSRWSVSRHLRCFGLAPLTLEGHRRPGSHLGTTDSTDGMAKPATGCSPRQRRRPCWWRRDPAGLRRWCHSHFTSE